MKLKLFYIASFSKSSAVFFQSMEEVNTADRQWQLDSKNEELDRCNKTLERTVNRAQGNVGSFSHDKSSIFSFTQEPHSKNRHMRLDILQTKLFWF